MLKHPNRIKVKRPFKKWNWANLEIGRKRRFKKEPYMDKDDLDQVHLVAHQRNLNEIAKAELLNRMGHNTSERSDNPYKKKSLDFIIMDEFEGSNDGI